MAKKSVRKRVKRLYERSQNYIHFYERFLGIMRGKESFIEVNYGTSQIWLHTRQQQRSK